MPNTPTYSWNMPTVGADLDTWGDELNATTILIDLEVAKKANITNPIFTGVITAPAFMGDPSCVLRPKVDSAQAILLQNAGASTQAWMDTLTGQMTFGGSVLTPLYTSSGNVTIRPGADNGASIQFQKVGGGIVGFFDTNIASFNAGTGGITSPFYSGAKVILRPQSDSADSIQFQNSAAAVVGQINTSGAQFAMSGSILCPVYLSNAAMIIRPGVDSVGAILMQNVAGSNIAVVDTLNGQFVVSTSIKAPVHTAPASIIFKPGADSTTAFRFQNTAGTDVLTIGTTGGTVVISGGVQTPAITGNTNLALRPSVDGATAIQFQQAGGTVIGYIDTTANRYFQWNGRMFIADNIVDNNPALSVSKPAGGQARILLSAVADTAAYVDYRYGAQVWFAGPGIVQAANGSFDILDQTASYIPIRCHAAAEKKQITMTDWVSIGAEDGGVFGALTVNGARTMVDTVSGTTTVARFTGTSQSAIIFDTRNALNPSGYRRGIYWSFQGDDFAISRFANNGAAAAKHDFYINTSGNVGIGTTSIAAPLHVHRAIDGVILGLTNDNGNGMVQSTTTIAMGRSVNQAFSHITTVQTFGGTYGEGSLVFATRGSDVMTEHMRLDNKGFLSVSSVAVNPTHRLHVYGTGTSETSILTPSNNMANSVLIADGSGSFGAGGALFFGAGSSTYAGIRSLYINGAGNGQGDIVFYLRTNTAEAFLREMIRFKYDGGVQIHSLPQVNPGAGTHGLWADPADGYRVKWAA